MPDEIDLRMRKFAIGEPGVPAEGIMLGHGGGFIFRFADFVLLPNGTVQFLTYVLGGDGAPIPPDHEHADLLQKQPAEEYKWRLKQLMDMDFGRMPSPPLASELAEYLVLVHPSIGIHAVLWGNSDIDKLPADLRQFVLDFRARLCRRFQEEHA